ncbi:MAG: hypothetical protein ACLUOI_05575 [Eisenbergiella sp.]
MLENCSEEDMSPIRRFGYRQGRAFRISFRIPLGKGRKQYSRERKDSGLEVAGQLGCFGAGMQEDDVITVTCPFSLEFKPVDEKNKDIAALMFGPVVLAADKMTLFDGDMEKPEEWITCVDEKEMLFRTLPGHVCPYPQEVRTFRPYYKIPVMEWYFMYVRFRMQTEERR